jgi:hypothetical protein
MEDPMLVATARFPEVPPEREAKSRAWFAWSNGQRRCSGGLRGHRLLHAEALTYTVLVEHASADTLAAKPARDAAERVDLRPGEVLDEQSVATVFDSVVDLATSVVCCGGGGGHNGPGSRDEVTFGVSTVALDAVQMPSAMTHPGQTAS